MCAFGSTHARINVFQSQIPFFFLHYLVYFNSHLNRVSWLRKWLVHRHTNLQHILMKKIHASIFFDNLFLVMSSIIALAGAFISHHSSRNSEIEIVDFKSIKKLIVPQRQHKLVILDTFVKSLLPDFEKSQVQSFVFRLIPAIIARCHGSLSIQPRARQIQFISKPFTAFNL